MNHSNLPVRQNRRFPAILSSLLLGLALPVYAADPAPIRVGMIGLDTSHVPAFTRIFNNPEATGDLAGIKIVAGYPGGTDMPASHDRVERFTEQLRDMGIRLAIDPQRIV